MDRGIDEQKYRTGSIKNLLRLCNKETVCKGIQNVAPVQNLCKKTKVALPEARCDSGHEHFLSRRHFLVHTNSKDEELGR